jgi:HK97 family phage portal protein
MVLMSRYSRFRDAIRGIWQGPIYSSDPNLREFFGSTHTTTGVSVTEASATTYSAVWAAINCISSDIAALPLHMYKRNIVDGGKDRFISNPLYRLVHDIPNPQETSMEWRRVMMAHVLLYGNGYSEIVRDGGGRPTSLWHITPDRVTPWLSNGELVYRVVNRDSSDDYIPASDMLHIRGIGWDGYQGYGVIAKACESIGLGMAAEQFGAAMYGNGLAIGGVISFPGAKPPELSEDNFIKRLNSRHQGVDRAHKLLALYNGAKYEPMNIKPNEAQFLETRKFQVAEIARWFNLPPHKLGDLSGSTHSNIEQQSIDYYTNTLLPILKTWEQELYLKLVPVSERNIQFFEHDAKGFLRADSQMRWEAFSRQFMAGAITPNEMREAENLNPVKGGDATWVPLNQIPTHLSEPWFQADIEEKLAKAVQAKRPPPEPVAQTAPGPNRDAEVALLTESRDTARRCAQEVEDAKDIIAAELAGVRVEMAHLQSERDALAAKGIEDTAAHQRQIEGLSLDVTVAQRDGQEAEARATEAQRMVTEWQEKEAEARTVSEQLTRQIAEFATRMEALDADYKRVCEEKIVAEQDRMGTAGRLASVEAERAGLQERTESLSLDVTAAQQDVVNRDSRITALEAEALKATEARTQADAVNQATVVELRSQIATVSQELASVNAALLEATTRVGSLDTTHALDRARVVEMESELTARAERMQQTQARLNETQQAVRATVVDAANRLIAKETERARKAQGSPAKLGAWIETFYPLHEDFCRVALKPAVRAVLVAQGSEAAVDRVLDRVVLAHISESSRQLQAVLMDADVESLGPALERVLRRWEAERAEALLDRILKEAA